MISKSKFSIGGDGELSVDDILKRFFRENEKIGIIQGQKAFNPKLDGKMKLNNYCT